MSLPSSQRATVEELVIEALSDELAELRELAHAYREMAQSAIAQLAEGHANIEAARRRNASLVAELRALRGTVAA